MVACNDDKEDGGNKIPELGVQPVAVSTEIQEFFEENLEEFAGRVLYENGVEPSENACVMINSVDELPDVDLTLPIFDFATHTLVVGQYIAGNAGSYPAQQGVVVRDGTATFNVVVRYPGGDDMELLPVISSEFFWGLYPKMPTISTEVNVLFN